MFDITPNEDIRNRFPICFCIDTSGSMTGERIEKLTKELFNFCLDIERDNCKGEVFTDLCIVSFGEKIETHKKFFSQDKQSSFTSLIPAGGTPMGEGVKHALLELEGMKEHCNDVGISYYKPILVLMTDGSPTDLEKVELVLPEIQKLIEENRLTVISIGIGNDVDMDLLSNFSEKIPAIKLKELNYRDFFMWLRSSRDRLLTNRRSFKWKTLIIEDPEIVFDDVSWAESYHEKTQVIIEDEDKIIPDIEKSDFWAEL